MGWDSTYLHMNESVEDAMLKEYEGYKRHNWDVLAWNKAKDGGYTIYYAAIKDNDTDEVFALITLTQRRGAELFRKELGENDGPMYFGANAKVLDLLTPTDKEFANAWRDNCRNAALTKTTTRKVTNGDLIEFDDPITFRNGNEFKVLKFEGYSRFRDPATNQGYHVTNWRNMKYKVLA